MNRDEVKLKNVLRILMSVFFTMLCVEAVPAALQVHLQMDNNLLNAVGGPNGVLQDGNAGTHGYVPGRIGQAFHLQNDQVATGGDYVSLSYTMPNSGTVALWYKPDSFYNYNTIFDNSGNLNNWESWIYSDGRVRFRVQSGTEVTASLNTLAADGNAVGKWWHCTVTWAKDGSNVITQMYINGTLMEEKSGPWVAPGSTFYLGGGNNGNIYGNGAFDDVRIYNTVLSAEEIGGLALNGMSITSPSRIKEGQSSSYQVHLTYPPSADVTVTVTPDSNRVSLNGQPAGMSATLLFHPADYAVPQCVNVMAIDNSIVEKPQTVMFTNVTSSSDPYWSQDSNVTVLVTITDNDCGAWGYPEMDFDQDCYVDMEDFNIFCEQWLMCSNPQDANCMRFNKTLVIAHRGYSAVAPENTLAAFNAARGYADFVELDAYSCADGNLVVMHDSTVDRTTDGTGPISSFTVAQLKQLDAGSWFSPEFTGERVPTLAEAINAILPDMTPCIERKGGTASQYVNFLQAMGVADKVILISFDEDFLNSVHALAPEIKLGLLGSGTITDELLVRLAVEGITIVNWSYSAITEADIQKIQAVGLQAYVWVVDSSDDIQAFADFGVEGIAANQTALARSIVDQ